MNLFITGFLQVFFVAINTYFISTKNLYGTAMAGFVISFIWSSNVKKVVFGTMKDRITYSLGAGLGSFIGLIISIWLF